MRIVRSRRRQPYKRSRIDERDREIDAESDSRKDTARRQRPSSGE